VWWWWLWRHRLCNIRIAVGIGWRNDGKLGRGMAEVAGKARGRPSVHGKQVPLQSLQDVHVNS
jgi:hypothetical protein